MDEWLRVWIWIIGGIVENMYQCYPLHQNPQNYWLVFETGPLQLEARRISVNLWHDV
jgi:hypothetical protein